MDLYARPNQDPSRPCMVTAALSGVVANRAQCPAIPYTPEEYAAEAKRAYEAGAAAVHLHARSPEGAPSFEVVDYQAIRDAIVAECPVIINFSTGALDVSIEKRLAYLTAVKPAVAALNMGSMNYAKYNQKKKGFVFDFVFPNPFSEIRALLEGMNAAGIKPECECFDAGHVGSLYPLIDMGLLAPPFQVSLIMGVIGGVPGTVSQLMRQVELLPPDSDWEVIALSLDQWRLLAAGAAMGGNVRVGLEDNFYLSPGQMASSNGDLVAKAVRMVRDQGREVATVEQCRERLGLVHA
ncbi:MAG: 3-keto-5-aminohexanoate cleavage protein [Pseudomonadota bacterium]|nr:3-keto-5-aminohexanoate cleavage protein [Pseudomonadota bacterium]